MVYINIFLGNLALMRGGRDHDGAGKKRILREQSPSNVAENPVVSSSFNIKCILDYVALPIGI